VDYRTRYHSLLEQRFYREDMAPELHTRNPPRDSPLNSLLMPSWKRAKCKLHAMTLGSSLPQSINSQHIIYHIPSLKTG